MRLHFSQQGAQVRLIVWRAKDVVAKDGVEQPTNQQLKDGADPAAKSSSCFGFCGCCCGGSTGSSDVFVTAQFEGMEDKKETDVKPLSFWSLHWLALTCIGLHRLDADGRCTGAPRAPQISTGE